jgi:hypothetical protein
MVTAAEQAALADLGFHWGDYYAISVSGSTWRAVPLGDPAGALTARDPARLREKIRADYFDRTRLRERMST